MPFWSSGNSTANSTTASDTKGGATPSAKDVKSAYPTLTALTSTSTAAARSNTTAAANGGASAAVAATAVSIWRAAAAGGGSGEESRESGPRESRRSGRGGGGGTDGSNAVMEWRLVRWAQRAAAAAKAKFRLSEERRPEVPRYVVVGVTAIAVLSVLTGLGANNICNLAGFLYPLYMSWKAVRSSSSTDDTQWLTYWVVYGVWNVTESATRFLGITHLPFYSALKIAFLVWCFLPHTRGAEFIFHRILTPTLQQYEARIDRFAAWWVGETQSVARDIVQSTSGELQRRVSNLGGNLMRAITDTVNDRPANANPNANANANGGGGAVIAGVANAVVGAADVNTVHALASAIAAATSPTPTSGSVPPGGSSGAAAPVASAPSVAQLFSAD